MGYDQESGNKTPIAVRVCGVGVEVHVVIVCNVDKRGQTIPLQGTKLKVALEYSLT